MSLHHRTPKPTSLAAGLFLAAGTAAASAHGTAAGAPHIGTAISTLAHTDTIATSHSPSHRPAAPSGGVSSAGSITSTTPPPDFSSQCEGEVSANCEAAAESRYTISNGDANPVWSAPVPTTVPPTPPVHPINEPQAATEDFEQSGAGSGVTITAGGGPTLADCMALWEPAVHMTKQLWKNVCIRTMNGIDEPQIAIESIDPGYVHPKHTAREARN